MKTVQTIIITCILAGTLNDSIAEVTPVILTRYALAIGSNTATKNRPALRYALSDARAFSRVLTGMGGLRKEYLITISNPSLKEFTDGIGKLKNLVKRTPKAAGRKEIIIYYSGHADENGIILGKESLLYPDFRKLIDAIPADIRIAVLDACASGSLTREKGGKRRPAFLFDASSDMKGHAYLTSSSFDEAAQESDRIKGSFFTHYLVSAMRGGADANSDGKVTLNEAYEFAFDETLRRTEKTLSGPQHAAYDIRLKGSGDLVMTDLRASSAGLRLSPSLSGRVFVRDSNGMLLAELNKMQGKQMEIGLEPGEYEVTLEKPPQVKSTQVSLISGKYTELLESHLDKSSIEHTVARGDVPPSAPPGARDEYRRVPFNISLLPALSIGGKSDKIVTHCAISILAGYTTKQQGVSISSGINTVSENAHGAMIGASGNFCSGAIDGIQIAGGINIAGDSSHCAQIAGGFNKAHALYGIQITGGANIATGSIPVGVQIAGGFNAAAGSVKGLQITGGANVANGTSHCAQIAGGFNKAHALYGIQITGGANIATDSIPGGVQIAGGANITKGNLKGIQITGGFNQATGQSYGMHIAGGMNLVNKGVTGGQIAGGVNYSTDHFQGIQISGGANIAHGTYHGVQITGGINLTKNITGAQIGIVNRARSVKGVQIGIINICDTVKGLPIGLFSFIRNNPPHARLWTDESGFIQTGLRSGTDRFYSLVSIGARPQRNPYAWSIGYGLGCRFPIRRAFIGIEKLFIHSNEGRYWDSDQMVHTKDMVLAGFQFASHFSIWGGPVLNMYWSESKTDKKLAYWDLEFKKFRSSWYSIWPGFIVGVEF